MEREREREREGGKNIEQVLFEKFSPSFRRVRDMLFLALQTPNDACSKWFKIRIQ